MPFLSVTDGRLVSGNGKGRKLTPKMVEFVDLYMIHMNATKAVELGSYKTKNAGRHANELMQHPLIREEIDRRLKERSKKNEVTAEYLINKLVALVDSSEIKTSDQLRAIELLGKSIALWKERQEISGPDGQAIRHEQNIQESVSDFTTKIAGLAKRSVRTGTDNVIPFTSASQGTDE